MTETTPNQTLLSMDTLGQHARKASRAMARASTEQKNNALIRLAFHLRKNKEALIALNHNDVLLARTNALKASFIDRLTLNDTIIESMAQGCEQVASLPDPIGAIDNMRAQPSGIRVGQMRVPLGVLGIIYESRPNVTIDAAALAIKSGNAAILRGGSESFQTNQALLAIVEKALSEASLPKEAIQMLPSSDRALVGEMIRAKHYIDVLIPRGGKSLIERLSQEATVPMIKHLHGICHTYIDENVSQEMAVRVTDNAKTQRYSPCNATETLLIHQKQVREVLPALARIFHDKNVEMRCDGLCRRIVEQSGFSSLDATEKDWDTEYNAPIISIKCVASLEEAIDFINLHGSHHTDAILTNLNTHAERFLREVDSASVMVNTSTRFADGFEYGLGAEIGISTDKLHARGPVGLLGLTSQKYIILGHGECRQ